MSAAHAHGGTDAPGCTTCADTRPVRDQIAAIIRRETNAASYRPVRPETAADAVLALPVIADALAAKAREDAPVLGAHGAYLRAERDALRTTVDRVRALLDEAQPLLTAAVSALYGAKVPEWDRVDDATGMVIAARGALDGTAQDEPRRIEWGIDKGGTVRFCRDEAQAREIAADPRRGGTAVFYDPSDPEAAWQPAPAAQGEPLTGDPEPPCVCKSLPWRHFWGPRPAPHPDCPADHPGDPRRFSNVMVGEASAPGTLPDGEDDRYDTDSA